MLCHSVKQSLELLCLKVVKHACGIEHRALAFVKFNLVKPRKVVEVARDILFSFTCGKQFVSYVNHVGQIKVVTSASAVIHPLESGVKSAAEIDNCRFGMRFQIILNLASQIVIPLRRFKCTEQSRFRFHKLAFF